MKSDGTINRAALDIKPLNVLIPGRPLYSFRIIGADLALLRTSDGRYVLSGLGVSDTGSGGEKSPRLRDVALNGEVRLQDISLSFDDPERGIHLVLSNVNGRLMASGRNVSAEIKASVTDRGKQRVVVIAGRTRNAGKSAEAVGQSAKSRAQRAKSKKWGGGSRCCSADQT